jgi:transcriptional regulator with XRE-family HTH domain
MYLSQKDANYEAARKKGGLFLKKTREKAGLTQKELADRLGIKYYTFVSQIESGKGRVPPDLYDKWAEAVSMETSDFVKKLLVFYDPVTFKALFGLPTKKDLNV